MKNVVVQDLENVYVHVAVAKNVMNMKIMQLILILRGWNLLKLIIKLIISLHDVSKICLFEIYATTCLSVIFFERFE